MSYYPQYSGYSHLGQDTAYHPEVELTPYPPSYNNDPHSTFRDNASYRSSAPLLDPQAGPSRPQSLLSVSSIKKWRRRRMTGWRGGVVSCAFTAGTVLIINSSFLIWGLVKRDASSGFGTIFEGRCTKEKSLTLWIHLAINILSTVLLSASNYCMQVLSAPTREEVNKAHAKGFWMDIGVPSVRNLGKISRQRLLFWWILGCSSIPLHLMYNSAVFSTLAANDYLVLSVTEDFVNGGAWDTAPTSNLFSTDKAQVQRAQNQSENFDRLENAACIQAYAVEFQSSRSTVLLIADPEPNTNNTLIDGTAGGESDSDPYNWICRHSSGDGPASDLCSSQIASIVADASNWVSSVGPKVKYCLSEPVPEHSCNLVKAIVMSMVIWRCKIPPLVTVGDAVSSFLTVKDKSTEGMCTARKGEFSRLQWGPNPRARQWRKEAPRWFGAASRKRWWLCISLFGIAIAVSAFLLGYGISQMTGPTDIKTLWNLGPGAINSNTLISWNIPSDGVGGLISNVLVANSPQIVLSFLYLTLNGLLSCMLLADEYNRFSYERKPLRVTDPVAPQRSTYFLQLPYKIAIPLLIFSGVLHWLISQSIFLARVSYYDPGSSEVVNEISTCGYSPIAIIFTIVTGCVLIIGAILIGFRRFKPGIPLAGSNSAAIAAACHAPEADTRAAVSAVQWGVVPTGNPDFGHCCFTSQQVTPPMPDTLYAGLSDKPESPKPEEGALRMRRVE
ncbi:MAG: hypothetical protein M1824_003016 [Vezdaea acicularis]|nr:MAG: hypothetical protein M1824_003016 [Vezdaea acicularis]